MGQTTSGLPEGGKTETGFFQISYDESFPGTSGLTAAMELYSQCEFDLRTIQGFFPGVTYQWDWPIIVYINNDGGDNPNASWLGPDKSDRIFGGTTDVQLHISPGQSLSVLRFLLAAEVSEMFMASQNTGWWYGEDFFHEGDEGSKGEALSGFLAFRLAVAAGADESTLPLTGRVQTWLNSGRPNYIDNTPDDDATAVIIGCGTCFLLYLYYQRNFSEVQIVQAGADSLGEVYSNLTGQSDGWQTFINLCAQYFPSGLNLYSARIFPVPQLQSISDLELASGETASMLLTLASPAVANIPVSFYSDDNDQLITYANWARFAPGSTTLWVTVTAQPVAEHVLSTRFHAAYGGQIVSAWVTITPPPSLSGTVTDTSGTPLPYSTVMIMAPAEIIPGGGTTLQLTTDDNGYYATPILPAQTYTVNAVGGDCFPSDDETATIGFGHPSAVLDFALDPIVPYIVEGQVNSDDGSAIENATVKLTGNSSDPSLIVTTTDDEGGYFLSATPQPYNGDYTCYVTASGFADQYQTFTIGHDGGPVVRNFVLPRLGSLSGLVTGQGQPVPQALVRGGGQVAWSDATGRYALAGLDPVPTAITVTAAGFDIFTDTAVIGAGASVTLDIPLTAATAIIQGVVNADDDDSPLAGAGISMGTRHAVSDANGFYQLIHVPAGAVTLTVGAPHFQARRMSLTIADGQTVTANFTLDRPPGPGPHPTPQAGRDGAPGPAATT